MKFQITTPRILLALIVAVQIITHLAWLPISTQMGQMAVPYMLNHGGILFDTVIENRAPGLAVFLALVQRISPFDDILTLRALNLILIVALTVAIYLLGRKLSPSAAVAEWTGLIAALFWFVFEPVYGNILFYFDSINGALYLAVACLFIFAKRKGWWLFLAGGLLLGFGTLIKQHAWGGVLAFGVWLLIFERRQVANLAAYIIGVAVFPLASVIIFAVQGTLSSYLLWNWQMNFGPVRPVGGLDGDFLRKFGITAIAVPIFAFMGWRQQNRRDWMLVVFLWLGACLSLLPAFSESYVMSGLPLLSVMTGIVLVQAIVALKGRSDDVNTASIYRPVLIGGGVAIMGLWAWMAVAAYAPGPLGRAGIPAYDEFKPVSERLLALADEGDTLFMLPEFDGSAQLHVLTDLLPPGTFTGTHRWFLAAGLGEQLLEEWAQKPPTWMVYFPQFDPDTSPESLPLIEFMRQNYELIETVEAIPFNGDALLYRLREDR